MTWNDITINKYYEIMNIINVQDEYTGLNLIDCIYGVDANEIPITELGKYDISFLNEAPKAKDEIYSELVLNGNKYDVDCNLTHVTAMQFVDFNNYNKGKDTKFEDALSVFVYPKGMKYSDVYDKEQVKEDLKCLSIIDAITMAKFFFLQFRLFAEIFQVYLKEELKEMKMENKESENLKRMILEKLEALDLGALEYCHTF